MQNDMRDRLVELLKNSPHLDTLYCEFEDAADWLIANSVIVPPCKVGQTIYYLDGKTIVKDVVHCISVGGRHGVNAKGFVHFHDSDKDNITVNFNLFGDKVFLTKEQAEQKLKELSDDDSI